MRTKDLAKLGVPKGPLTNQAISACQAAAESGVPKKELLRSIASVVASPGEFIEDPIFGNFARDFADYLAASERYEGRASPAPYRQWGVDLEPQSVRQMENACRLPVAVRGALMPDAHLGYGLPIGGVLATENTVIPYAVGVDIACRMKMTVFDLPASTIDDDPDRLTKALERETRFGIGASFEHRRQHDVMDRDWDSGPITKGVKDKAWKQLGTSGSGNHFVEFGVLTIDDPDAGLDEGEYLALLSHSGSRGAGATIADHYSKLAMRLHPELPRELQHLAWLDLDTDEGREYWEAMSLMGHYAAANHALIHACIAARLGVEVLLDVENHHNFAWKEVHDDREVIVHRKGATPAGEGVLGIIPGSMADNCYLVRGRGNPGSLNSASHGAGRVMSRKKAKSTFTWAEAKRVLDAKRVTLLSAGLDEVPMVYKNIESVMAAQADLVEPLARFAPRLVKMAPAGERPED
ncbi:MAG: RtcB family protein [Planctomycetes bacterium]|nr:RtcB family protein [Planctomycetota bacterium]